MNFLLNFLGLVLRVAPRALWMVLGGLVLAGLNHLFVEELWPHTPLAQPVIMSLLLSGLMVLPGLAAQVAWRLAEAVPGYFWKAVWRFVALAGFFVGTLAVFGGLMAQAFLWSAWQSGY